MAKARFLIKFASLILIIITHAYLLNTIDAKSDNVGSTKENKWYVFKAITETVHEKN